MLLDSINNILTLASVSIANRAAKFQTLFHVHNSAIIMQY